MLGRDASSWLHNTVNGPSSRRQKNSRQNTPVQEARQTRAMCLAQMIQVASQVPLLVSPIPAKQDPLPREFVQAILYHNFNPCK
jgi:hypothetical protein